MLSLLKDLGVPAVILALLIGLVAGAVTTHFYMQIAADAHAAEIAALTAQLDQAQLRNKELREALVAQQNQIQGAQTSSCQQITAQLAQAQTNIQTLGQWNNEWRDANAGLLQKNVLLQQRDNLARELERLREKWVESAYAIKQFTSGRCSDDSNTCDLIPLAQRKLRALETERDQLNMQLLDMQTRIACVK